MGTVSPDGTDALLELEGSEFWVVSWVGREAISGRESDSWSRECEEDESGKIGGGSISSSQINERETMKKKIWKFVIQYYSVTIEPVYHLFIVST